MKYMRSGGRRSVSVLRIPRNAGFWHPPLLTHSGASARLELKYYDVFNQGNIDIVDLRTTPIMEVTPKDIKTSTQGYEFDVLIFATGAFVPMPIQCL